MAGVVSAACADRVSANGLVCRRFAGFVLQHSTSPLAVRHVSHSWRDHRAGRTRRRGKTALATGIAVEIAAGIALLDENIFGTDLRVLFINGEDGGIEIKRRIWAFRLAHAHKNSEENLDRLYVAGADDPRVQKLSFLQTTERNFSTVDRTGFGILQSALEALRPDVLILDPLVTFCGGGNMNDNSVMSQVMRELKRLAAKFDCALLVVHHTRKGRTTSDDQAEEAERISGAAAIVNLARRASCR